MIYFPRSSIICQCSHILFSTPAAGSLAGSDMKPRTGSDRAVLQPCLRGPVTAWRCHRITGNQPLMPIRQRARGKDGGDLFEPLQIDFLGLGGESWALVVVEPRSEEHTSE